MSTEQTIHELRLRLADVAEILATADEDGEIAEERTGGLLSAMDYALRGDPGCVEPEEWEAERERALASHGDYLGVGDDA